MIAIVFCRLLPENVSKNAIPNTIPGIVFVTREILSITFLHFSEILLRAVTNAAPYTTREPKTAVSAATSTEFFTTIISSASWNTETKCSVVKCTRYGHSSINGTMIITAKIATTQSKIAAEATAQTISLVFDFFISISETLLYRMLYLSR